MERERRDRGVLARRRGLLHQAQRHVRVSELPQPVQVEEVDAGAPAAPVQQAAAVRVPALLDEELPEDTHYPPPARPPPAPRGDILRQEAERLLPAAIEPRDPRPPRYDCCVE